MSEDEKNWAAVIVSAGNSSRMGGYPKAKLRIGQESFIEREVSVLRAAGVEDIVVVLGKHRPLIEDLLEHLSVTMVENKYPERGMFESVRLGLASLEARADGFFIHPVDLPLLEVDTLENMQELFSEEKLPCTAPSINGRRGHPPFFSEELREELLRFSGEGGLRAFQNQYLERTAWYCCNKEELLFDVDDGDDYQSLLQEWPEKCRGPEIPEKERRSFIDHFSAQDKRLEHGRKVAKLAMDLYHRLMESRIDKSALPQANHLETAALLHDCAKGLKGHDVEASREARRRNWHSVAAMMGSHMNIFLTPNDPIDGRQILYLADKACKGDEVVGIEKNFSKSLHRWKDNEGARLSIMKRIDDAKRILSRFEEILDPLRGLQ